MHSSWRHITLRSASNYSSIRFINSSSTVSIRLRIVLHIDWQSARTWKFIAISFNNISKPSLSLCLTRHTHSFTRNASHSAYAHCKYNLFLQFIDKLISVAVVRCSKRAIVKIANRTAMKRPQEEIIHRCAAAAPYRRKSNNNNRVYNWFLFFHHVFILRYFIGCCCCGCFCCSISLVRIKMIPFGR